jgi:hypothetical protein
MNCCCCGSDCCCCGGNPLSMSTVQPNPSVSQGVRGNCGGASCISNTLNAIGKWGTVLTASLQGKPVATTGTGGVSVGAKGATSLPGQFSGNSMIVILLVVGALIFLATRR